MARGSSNAICKPCNSVADGVPPKSAGPTTWASELTAKSLRAATADPKRIALVDCLTALTMDARRELMALIGIGRGDDARWEDAMENARRSHADWHVSYIISKRSLGDLLTEGLVKLQAPD